MLRTVAVNLKPDGVFVGICAPPVGESDLPQFEDLSNEIADRKRELLRMELKYRTDDTCEGLIVDFRAFDEYGEATVAFTAFHLAKETYEVAAKRAGMEGRLEWMPVTLSEEVRAEISRRGQDELFEDWEYELGPHFGVVVIHKT